jgi:hypothetical protein
MTAGAAGFRRTQDLRSAQNHDETVSFDQNQDERKSGRGGISTAEGARDLTAVVDRDEIAAKTPGDEVGEAERRGVYEWRECPDLWRRWGWEELAAI